MTQWEEIVAIKECKECEGAVSTKAETCPHCGCPEPVEFHVEGYSGTVSGGTMKSGTDAEEQTQAIVKLGAFIAVGLLLLFSLVSCFRSGPCPDYEEVVAVCTGEERSRYP